MRCRFLRSGTTAAKNRCVCSDRRISITPEFQWVGFGCCTMPMPTSMAFEMSIAGSTITASASIQMIRSKPICIAERIRGIFPHPALFGGRRISLYAPIVQPVPLSVGSVIRTGELKQFLVRTDRELNQHSLLTAGSWHAECPFACSSFSPQEPAEFASAAGCLNRIDHDV